jgi:hypothetical protein
MNDCRKEKPNKKQITKKKELSTLFYLPFFCSTILERQCVMVGDEYHPSEDTDPIIAIRYDCTLTSVDNRRSSCTGSYQRSYVRPNLDHGSRSSTKRHQRNHSDPVHRD